MESKVYKRALSVLILAMMIMSSFVVFGTEDTYAASSKVKKVTVYDQVIKSGKYAYCATSKGIYKVNLKTNKVKRILKTEAPGLDDPFGMTLYKGYIYYITQGGTASPLYRVSINGKNDSYLHFIWGYAISNGRIYYTTHKENDYTKEINRSMTLNGKHKRKSSYRVKMTSKKSNAKGYYVDSVETDTDVYTQYLVKPNGKKIKLCRYKY